MTEQPGLSNSPPEDAPQSQEESRLRHTANAHEESLEKLSSIDPMPEKPLQLDLANLKTASLESGIKNGKTNELLEELAEDLLILLQKVKTLEINQAAVIQQMQELSRINQEQLRQHAYDMDKLRKDLLSERKALAARSTFNAILPNLDSLLILRAELPGGESNPAFLMLDAVISSLVTITQTLGIQEYESAAGAAFDPQSMECLGQEEGSANLVVKTIRRGYKYGEQVFRPCGVIIGNSDKANSQSE